jgi:outer membrane protein OmpA-like peptidoglycan-associated protein
MLRILLLALLLPVPTLAQTQTEPQKTVPIFRIRVVGRTIPAINYRNHSGSTKVDFRGTSLMPMATGRAEVQSKQGAIRVDAEMKHLQPASKFGPEYLTYVLWAISPEGRPVNLGEVLLDGAGNSKLDVTSDLQSFGLIVTAEPYFAVTQPSDVVVMENFVTRKTNGTIEEVDAKYELLERGQYTLNVSPSELHPMMVDWSTPLELYEAKNAVRIAKWAGADQYAADTLAKAEADLHTAEGYWGRNKDRKDLITAAREAVQDAEDARIIAVKKMLAEQQEQTAQAAEAAQAQAQQAQAQAQQAQAQAEQEAQAKAQAQAAQAAAEQQQQQAQAEAVQAQDQAQQARQQAAQAEKEKLAMRAKLLNQLNAILQTRDTARGLVVSMSDILFESGQYKLKSGAREALAKIAGVIMTYPGLTLEVDGYTDNVGGEESNYALSQKRAESVRNFLIEQGVPETSISARGLGEASPVATNDTRIGRQLNRRVELVLGGEVIGAKIANPPPVSSAGGSS